MNFVRRMHWQKQYLISAIEMGQYYEVKRQLQLIGPHSFLAPNRTAYELLQCAVERRYPLITQAILRKFGKVNFPSDFGKPLLYTAIELQDLETVKVLVSFGADVNSIPSYMMRNVRSDNPSGFSALNLAIRNGASEIAQVLMCSGLADIESPSLLNRRPLHLAAQNRDPMIVHYLLEMGANYNVRDDFGDTPLHIAVASKCIDSAFLLLKYGADIQVRNVRGEKILHKAALSSPEILQFILTCDNDVNATDDWGTTPLHIAATRSLENVKILLDHGAIADAESDCLYALTPLLAAHTYGFVNIAKYLLDRGADVNFKISTGLTPLLYNFVLTRGTEPKKMAKLVSLYLEYGADVNVFSDISCVVSLSSVLTSPGYERVMQVFVKHIVKLKVKGSFVGKLIMKMIVCEEKLTKFYKSCVDQMVAMHEKIPDTNVRYFDVLMKSVNRVARFTRNENLVRGGKIKGRLAYEKLFPIYGKELTAQLRMGIERRDQLDEVTETCLTIFHPSLPDFWIEGLFDCLSDVDVKNLVKVCE